MRSIEVDKSQLVPIPNLKQLFKEFKTFYWYRVWLEEGGEERKLSQAKLLSIRANVQLGFFLKYICSTELYFVSHHLGSGHPKKKTPLDMFGGAHNVSVVSISGKSGRRGKQKSGFRRKFGHNLQRNAGRRSPEPLWNVAWRILLYFKTYLFRVFLNSYIIYL